MPMSDVLRVCDCVSHSQKPLNEDLFGHQGPWAWMIDGSTPLSGRQLAPQGSDAYWYVQQLHHYLQQHALAHHQPHELMHQALAWLAQQYQALWPEGWQPDAADVPSASIALVHLTAQHIEVWALGDCPVLLLGTDSHDAMLIADNSLQPFDQAAVAAIHAAQRDQGLSFVQARQHVLPLLRRNRSMKNQVGGYWILDFDTQALAHAQHHRLPRNRFVGALMATDGFFRYFDLYQAPNALPSYLQQPTGPLAHMLEAIRAAEQADPECLRYPRVSVSDDATAARLAW